MRIPARILGLAAVLALAAGARAADRVATDAELQSLLEQKQYRACLQQSSRVLALRGEAAKGYDLCVIHLRRGECLVNLNDTASAVIAYTAALNAASSPERADEARAMIALLRASRSGNYYAKAAPQTPINIVDLSTRKEAMKALFTDKFTAAGPEIRVANEARTLDPIIKFLPMAQELHALEMLGTGGDPVTRPVLLGLGEKARGMVVAEIKALDARVAAIEVRANQVVSSGTVTATGANGMSMFVADSRLGLTSQDRGTLRELVPYISDIVNLSARGKQIAQTFGANGLVWDPIIADAERVMSRAQGVLDNE